MSATRQRVRARARTVAMPVIGERLYDGRRGVVTVTGRRIRNGICLQVEVTDVLGHPFILYRDPGTPWTRAEQEVAR